MIIREETIQDYEVVKHLVKKSFESAEHTDGDEYNLVGRLRKSEGFIKELSLVAEEDGVILGYIIFTKAKIGNITGLALAPLAVSPHAQKKGVGSALIKKGHEIAKSLGYDIVVVLGSEQYYPKFGYKPASGFGIQAPFEVPDENFMAVSLQEKNNKVDGIIEYVSAFFENGQ